MKWVTNKLKTCLFFSEKLYLKNNRVITRQYFIYKYITGRKKIAVVMTDLHLETLFWYLTFSFFIKKGGWFSLVRHSSSLRKNDFWFTKKGSRVKWELFLSFTKISLLFLKKITGRTNENSLNFTEKSKSDSSYSI